MFNRRKRPGDGTESVIGWLVFVAIVGALAVFVPHIVAYLMRGGA